MTHASLIGALLFLGLGLLELFVFMRSIYPFMSERHERQKLTQSQGDSPQRYVTFVRAQSLIGMPILGYFVGPLFISPMYLSSGAP